MTLYDEIKKHLESSPKARERKNKNRFIGWLIYKKYCKTQTGFDEHFMEDIVKDVENYDRMWRKVTAENEGLRGQDWEDGKRLAQEKTLELGYEVGFKQDVEKLKTL